MLASLGTDGTGYSETALSTPILSTNTPIAMYRSTNGNFYLAGNPSGQIDYFSITPSGLTTKVCGSVPNAPVGSAVLNDGTILFGVEQSLIGASFAAIAPSGGCQLILFGFDSSPFGGPMSSGGDGFLYVYAGTVRKVGY